MKKLFASFYILLACATAYGQSIAVKANGDGTLQSPTNFFSANNALTTVSTIAALRALGVAYTNGYTVATNGYTTAADGGAGTYVWNSSSTAADDGGTIIKQTAITTGRFFLQTWNGNVLQFGATIGSGDNTAAINAAYAAIPSTGGTLYFPSGNYPFNSPLSFTASKNLSIVGDGAGASTLEPTFSSADAITVQNAGPIFTMHKIGILCLASSPNLTTYLLHVLDVQRPIISDCYLNTGANGLIFIDGCNFVDLHGIQGESNAGSDGWNCLRVNASGGTYSNLDFVEGFQSGNKSGELPCVWVTGTSTSQVWSNNTFSGGGPHSKWLVSGITSTSGTITVTTTAPHDFQAGDFVVLRDCTPSTYNSQFRIASIPTTTTFTITSTLNPGTSTVNGTAESVSACMLLSNESGAVNEGSISGCLFSGVQANFYGTAGLYCDARRGAYGSRGPVEGWNFTGNYYDYGATGLLLSGTTSGSANEPTCFGFNVNGGMFINGTRAVHIDQAQSVNLDNIAGSSATPIPDQIGAPVTETVYIYAGPAVPYSQGIHISNSELGPQRGWDATRGPDLLNYGILIDSPGVQDFSVTGCNVFGVSAAITYLNSPVVSSQRWTFHNNTLNYGTWPATNTNVVPSYVSASSVAIDPQYETIQITGTTNIANLGPLWIGKKLDVVFTGALSLTTGGNFAIASNYSVLAGQTVHFVSNDGVNWFLSNSPAATAAGLGLGQTDAVTHASLVLNSCTVPANNPSPISGTLLHLTNADATPCRFGLDAIGSSTSVNGRRTGGTSASPTAVAASNMFVIAGDGYDSSVYSSNAATLVFAATQTFTPTAHGTSVTINTTPNGTTSAVAAATFDQDQSLTIGAGFQTSTPASGTAAKWKLGSYVSGQPSGTSGYAQIDIAGAAYQVPVGATPRVVGLDNRTGLTAADGAAITLFTTVNGTSLFRITADIFATAAVTGTAVYTITWTQNSTTQTMVVNSTTINTLATATDLINPDNATTITARLTGTFTGTFTVAGLVEQIK